MDQVQGIVKKQGIRAEVTLPFLSHHFGRASKLSHQQNVVLRE